MQIKRSMNIIFVIHDSGKRPDSNISDKSGQTTLNLQISWGLIVTDRPDWEPGPEPARQMWHVNHNQVSPPSKCWRCEVDASYSQSRPCLAVAWLWSDLATYLHITRGVSTKHSKYADDKLTDLITTPHTEYSSLWSGVPDPHYNTLVILQQDLL